MNLKRSRLWTASADQHPSSGFSWVDLAVVNSPNYIDLEQNGILESDREMTMGWKRKEGWNEAPLMAVAIYLYP